MSIRRQTTRNIYLAVAEELLPQSRKLLPWISGIRKGLQNVVGGFTPGSPVNKQRLQEDGVKLIRQRVAVRRDILG